MSAKVKLLIFFWAAGFVLPSPINEENHIDQRIDVPESPKFKDVSENHITNPKEDCAKENESSDCSNASEEISADNRLSFQQEQQAATDYWQPISSLPNYQQAYDSYPTLEAVDVGDGTYIDVLYPYLYPRLHATYNTGSNVNSLPPVHSTYIHGLVPQEELQQSRYDLNVFNPRRSLYYQPPAAARPVRMLRTPEEDFMAQLRHDAIMSNIVPTMQVPFARFAALAPAPVPAPIPAPAHYAPAPYAPTHYAPAIPSAGSLTALFPTAGSGCAQPILFSCTPKITRGTLRPSYAPAAALPAAEAISGYREVSKQSNNAVEHHNAPTKVDLVDKSAETKHAK